MKIFIASDHAGINLVNEIITNLPQYEIIKSKIKSSPVDDYPLFAFDICNNMNKQEDYAILICKTGIGISIAANKVKGIRCAKVSNIDEVISSKAHNYINALAFNASTSLKDAVAYINDLISTPNDTAERHQRRVNEIIKYENGEYNEL